MHFLSRCKVSGYFRISHTASLHQTKDRRLSFWPPCSLGVWGVWLISNSVLWPHSQEGKGSQTREKFAYFLVFWDICTHGDRIYSTNNFSTFLQGRNYTNVFVNDCVVWLAMSKHHFLGTCYTVPSVPSVFLFTVPLRVEPCQVSSP